MKTCLNLGCGNYPFRSSKDEEWINVDIGKKADLVLDVRCVGEHFGPETADYVFCCHLVEHLTYREGEKLIRDIYRLLKYGGVLELHLPELGMIIANQDAHIEGIYGAQRDEYDVHKSGWDFDTGKPYRRDLKRILEEIGFTILRAERHRPAEISILCSKGKTSQELRWRKTWAMEVYNIIEPGGTFTVSLSADVTNPGIYQKVTFTGRVTSNFQPNGVANVRPTLSYGWTGGGSGSWSVTKTDANGYFSALWTPYPADGGRTVVWTASFGGASSSSVSVTVKTS